MALLISSLVVQAPLLLESINLVRNGVSRVFKSPTLGGSAEKPVASRRWLSEAEFEKFLETYRSDAVVS